MENALWKILGFVLAVVLMYMVPMLNMYERQDDITYSLVFTETNKFADAARDMGYITPNMYNDFHKILDATGNLYEIEIVHRRKSTNPIYDTSSGTFDFQDAFSINFESYYTGDIMNILYPDNEKDVFDDSRRYKMGLGDYFAIDVTNTGKTRAAAIKDMMMFTDTEYPTIHVLAGGMVRNEDY